MKSKIKELVKPMKKKVFVRVKDFQGVNV